MTNGTTLPTSLPRDPRAVVRARAAENVATRRHRQRIIDWVAAKYFAMAGAVAILIILLIFLFLAREGLQAFRTIHPLRFIGTVTENVITEQPEFTLTWQPVSEVPKYSLVPLLTGSALVAIPATLFSGLVGLACGIFLSEIASRRLREIVKPGLELLAGIPTVIIGFFILVAVASTVQELFHTPRRLNAFVGALGVSIVIVPIIATLVEDALRAIPREIREGAYALGATRWETIRRVLIPTGISGITAAMILGMGRALGETMIVLMVTGNAAVVTGDIFKSVRTMTATLAAELGEVAQGSEQYHALFFVALVLFVITFMLNMIAEIVINRMRRKLTL
jgi:phosphate transport system permease protein